MEEIVFYGFNSNTPTKTGSWRPFKMRSKGSSIKVPFAYAFSRHTVLDLKPNSFAWPIMAKIIRPGEVYVPWMLVNEFSELEQLRQILLAEPNEATTLAISRPPAIDKCYQDYFFYLGVDHITVHNSSTGQSYTIDCDNRKIFELEGFDPVMIYRLLRGNHWYLDNVIPKDLPQVKMHLSRRITDLMSNENFSKFQEGFRFGYYSKNSFLETKGLNQVLLGGYVGDSFSFGYLIGTVIWSQIVTTFGKYNLYPERLLTKSNMIALKLVAPPEDFQLIMEMVDLHDKIELANPKNVFEILSQYFENCSKKVTSLNHVLASFDYLWSCDNNLNKSRKWGFDPTLAAGLMPEFSDDFKINLSFTFDHLQFRVHPKEGEFVRIRLQGKNLSLRQTIQVDGESEMEVSKWGQNSPEIDFAISPERIPSSYENYESFVSMLNSVSYNLPSTANSSQVYAKITLSQEGETEMFMVDGHPFLSKEDLLQCLRTVVPIKIVNPKV